MPTEEQIKQWKEQHGNVYCITVGEKEYYLRKYTRPEHTRFIDTLSQSLSGASRTLVAACLLDPNPQELKQELEINPGLHLQIAGELQLVVGGNQVVSSKNL